MFYRFLNKALTVIIACFKSSGVLGAATANRTAAAGFAFPTAKRSEP
jgi:hypothetical protein